jgi:protein gp37
MHPEWACNLRDECVVAGVPFFFKQWGEYAPSISVDPELRCFRFDHEGTGMAKVGKKAAGHLLDGKEWHEFPAVRG